MNRPDKCLKAVDTFRYARWLAMAAVAYNLLEGLVSLVFGWTDASLALFGFGADSLIEVGASLLVLWRLGEVNRARERRATLGIGLLFLLLAAGTAAGAVLQLHAHRHPATTLPGLLVATIGMGAMALLWREKDHAARALDSRALAGDARCSLVCLQLSAVLFVGSLAFRLWPALGWADAAAALVLALYIAQEGWGMASAARRKDFDGGCGCH